MEYECENCDWTGTWDDMIHETLCPCCRSATRPATSGNDAKAQAARNAQALSAPGLPPQ